MGIPIFSLPIPTKLNRVNIESMMEALDKRQETLKKTKFPVGNPRLRKETLDNLKTLGYIQ